MRRIAASLLLLWAGTVVAQQQQLRIVVVEGEGAVSIIQQKTAVRAVVEVRDQNNLPVSGATVTFAVTSKGGATIAGAPTVTVSTNAAGQAALTGVTPMSSGGLQISVNAAFNGLTASTSITQSVVTSVAAAGAAGTGAGAAGAGAAGAGAAGAGAATGAAVGGGLSTGAIAGIVGGVAAVGGGVAASSGGDGGGSGGGSGGGNTTGTAGPPPISTPNPNTTPTPSTPAPPPNPTGPPCRFLVSPTDVLAPLEGGTIGIAIVMEPEGCADQNWVVDLGSVSWISTDQRSGMRHGGIVLTIAPYTPTPNAINRVATINVAGTGVLVSQPCRCPAFAVRPPD